MIPSARLIWLLLAVAFPAAIVGAVLPNIRMVAVAVMLAIVLAAIIDALWRRSALAGIRIEFPELLRFVRGRQADVAVRIHNASERARKIRIGLVFPEGIDASPAEQWVSLPSGAKESKLIWRCDPHRRGRFVLHECFLEGLSPLGLWCVWRRDSVQLEMRTYRNLGADGLQALKRGWEGKRPLRQIGRGREFEKLREYTAGDSSDEIHWKATARRGRPITKVFQVERTQEVYVVIDTSRLSGRQCGKEEALEQAIRAALTVGAVAERRGDLFGVAAFSGQVEAFVRAKSGKTHYAACRDAINELTPRFVSPDFEEIAMFLRLRLRRRSLVVFLTALDDAVLAERFESATKLLARQHVVLVGMLQPDATRPLFSNGAVETPDDVYQSLAGHLSWKRLHEAQRRLARQGVQLRLFEPKSYASSLVNLYEETKRRQLL